MSTSQEQSVSFFWPHCGHTAPPSCPFTQLLAFTLPSTLPPQPGSPPVCFSWVTTFRPRDA